MNSCGEYHDDACREHGDEDDTDGARTVIHIHIHLKWITLIESQGLVRCFVSCLSRMNTQRISMRHESTSLALWSFLYENSKISVSITAKCLNQLGNTSLARVLSSAIRSTCECDFTHTAVYLLPIS